MGRFRRLRRLKRPTEAPAERWPADAEILAEVDASLCRRREMIFWQTAKVTRKARPGSRVPKRRAAGLSEWTVYVDTREKYPYRFADRPVTTERRALSAGDG